MRYVSSLADISKKFASYLIVARKLRYNCIYIFHVIFPKQSIWELIISQTNIFNIFPASVPILTVSKILQANYLPSQNKKYFPINSLQINRLFNELANKYEKICLAIDCSGMNPNGPGRFRTEVDNLVRKACYFNVQNNDQFFNVYINKRINNKNLSDEIYFEIGRVKRNTNMKTFDKDLELGNLIQNGTNDYRCSQLRHVVNRVRNYIDTSENSSQQATRSVRLKFLLGK